MNQTKFEPQIKLQSNCPKPICNCPKITEFQQVSNNFTTTQQPLNQNFNVSQTNTIIPQTKYKNISILTPQITNMNTIQPQNHFKKIEKKSLNNQKLSSSFSRNTPTLNLMSITSNNRYNIQTQVPVVKTKNLSIEEIVQQKMKEMQEKKELEELKQKQKMDNLLSGLETDKDTEEKPIIRSITYESNQVSPIIIK